MRFGFVCFVLGFFPSGSVFLFKTWFYWCDILHCLVYFKVIFVCFVFVALNYWIHWALPSFALRFCWLIVSLYFRLLNAFQGQIFIPHKRFFFWGSSIFLSSFFSHLFLGVENKYKVRKPREMYLVQLALVFFQTFLPSEHLEAERSGLNFCSFIFHIRTKELPSLHLNS